MATVILDHRESGARWLDRGFSAALTPLAALYGIGQRLERTLRPRQALPAQPPSLTIGNLRVGGSGKTPVVADLGCRLMQSGVKVAVLSRGYRAGDDGDEPAWLRELGLSVELGADRRASFERARAAGAELLLLDDALQSRVLASASAAIVLERDLEEPPRVLPAGPAREGTHALARVHFLFVRCESGAWPPAGAKRPPQLAPGATIHRFRLEPFDLRPLEGSGEVEAEALGLLSGLARPQSFERDAQRFGLRPLVSLRFSDHAELGASERRAIEESVGRFGLRGFVLPEKNQRRFARHLRELGLGVHALRARIEWAEDPLPRIRELLALPTRK